MERLYLVCDECGETFDDMIPAKAHEANADNWKCTEGLYSIKPESEAF